jgi:signal transduction histidine kinase
VGSPPTTSSAALQTEELAQILGEERLQNARRINRVRFAGVTFFFALFLVLSEVLGDRTWQGNIKPFTVYWIAAGIVLWAGQRRDSIARWASLAVPFLDMPMVFFVQWSTYPYTPNPAAVAGYSIGPFVLLLVLASLSLQTWKIYLTAASGAFWEMALQKLAGVSVGAMVSSVVLMLLGAFICVYGAGRLRELIGQVVRELVEQRRTEAALREAQESKLRIEKLAAIGQLAAGVGHDLRNPLSIISNAFLIVARRVEKSELSKDSQLNRFLSLIEREVAVCLRIIGDLMDFAREQPLNLVPSSLRALGADALSSIQSSVKVQLLNEIPEELPLPLLDPHAFRRVLLNLVQNAAEAMPPDREGVVRLTGSHDSSHVFVSVVDNGMGIPEENRSRIFEPLFTTKKNGTGLGLAIVSGLIKKQGGSVEVISGVNEGTTFKICFPNSQQTQAQIG